MQSSTRVIINTGIQYIRTFIIVCIALYSSRIILQSLGEDNFGIYSLVGGVISMLAFINISLSSTTQRYLSFYQGEKNEEMQIKIFNNSILIQIFIGIVLALVMYFLTPFIFDWINIPPEKTETAVIVYYSMIVSIFFSMLSTPYLATLIAHENILFTSITQIVEAVFKLIIAISLFFVFYDRLIYYAIMITVIAVINFLVYLIYCHRKYDECKHISFKRFDYKILKEIFSFSGWQLYSTGCIVSRTQGIAIIFNKFFGIVINAAYGISLQLQGQISFISGSLLNAIRPQIIKAEGEYNREKMLRLAEIASKFSFLLLTMIVIPAVFEMKMVLSVWLGKTPEYAILFCRFVILTALVDQLTVGLGHANQAIGNIKSYSLVINTIKVLTLPAAYICLSIGLAPVSVMVCMLLFEFICCISRLFFLRKTGGLSIRQFIRRVFIPEIIPFVSTVSVCWLSHSFLPESLFWLSFLFSIIVLIITSYFVGLCEDEKRIINRFILKFIHNAN
jgi:O-antigen/teichoic acid export membrane protein